MPYFERAAAQRWSLPMDHYCNASTEAKRKTNRPVVRRLLRRRTNQRVSIQ